MFCNVFPQVTTTSSEGKRRDLSLNNVEGPVYSTEWQSFMLLIKERKLPRGCNLHAVQAQLYQYYKTRSITTDQWAEFETGIHRLDPSLPWRLKSATEIRG
jgi:hypothetical protein